jgi:hypothetical protein
MIPEDKYKNDLIGVFGYFGFQIDRHEDKFTNFIPDISFAGNRTDGWIEVKWCEKDPTSLGALDHWTKGQQSWLYDRGRAGSGHCYLLVGTPRHHILWRYDTLDTIRNQSFEAALQYAIHVAPDLYNLGDYFLRRVRPPGRVSA